MRNIKDELVKRLESVQRERDTIQRRLTIIAELESALKILIAEEDFHSKGSQLPLPISARPVSGRHVMGRTPLSRLLLDLLSDGQPRPLKDLAALAISRGTDFAEKSPSRVFHFALIGLQKAGYTKMVAPSIWQLTAKAISNNTLAEADIGEATAQTEQGSQ